MTLGRYPEITVARARKLAASHRDRVAQGHDPLEEKDTLLRAPTMKDLWERYESDHLPRLAKRGQSDQRAMWSKWILPALGNKKVLSVTYSDVEALHRKITTLTPVRANRVNEVLRKSFGLAIRWGWIATNPAGGFVKNHEEPRHLYLKPAEVRALLAALSDDKDQDGADAIRLLILTGARRGETLRAEWSQFDLEAGIWTKPSSHTKQRRVHRVPLSAPATALLKLRKSLSQSHLVFPGPSGVPRYDLKGIWRRVTKVAGLEKIRVHDLRHTYASLLISNGFGLAIIGNLLGHTQTQTTNRYAHLHDDALREASDKVAQITG